MANSSLHIQTPYHPPAFVRLDQKFTTRSGHKLKMRQVTVLADGSKLAVPQYINRQVFPEVPGYLNATKWIVTIGPVDFYVRDDDQTAQESLEKACKLLYENYDKPVAVLKALKASSKLERRRKNILTGVPGLSVRGEFSASQLEYSILLTNALPRKAYTPGAKFDPFNEKSVQAAYDEIMTLRHMIQRNGLTTPDEVIAMQQALRSQPSLVIKHAMPDTMIGQIHDNYMMRMADRKGFVIKW